MPRWLRRAILPPEQDPPKGREPGAGVSTHLGMNLMLLPPMVLPAAPHALWTGRRLLAPQYELSASFDCPHCLVFYGESCVNPAGKPIEPHIKRLRLVEKAWASDRLVVKLTRTVGELEKGDECVGRFDHESGGFSLIYRLLDGLPCGHIAFPDAVFMCWEEQLIDLA